jgi:hypothetical protein
MHFPARIAGGKSFLEATIPAPFESPRNGNIRRDVMMLNREGENSKIALKKGQDENKVFRCISPECISISEADSSSGSISV